VLPNAHEDEITFNFTNEADVRKIHDTVKHTALSPREDLQVLYEILF